MVIKHENKIEYINDNIKSLKESFEEKKKTNEIYYNGQIYDAYSKIISIFKSAKKRLIIIDSYADNELLNIIKKLNIDVILITTQKYIKQDIIYKYNLQYNNLKVIYNNTFHDRYFVVDNDIYHCGTSINRIGYKTFSITILSDKDVCNSLLDKIVKLII